jgi:uncharacterized glyoxalase superfamily protein PhnB
MTAQPTGTPPVTADAAATRVWPCVNYRDAHRAIEFLTTAFGFERRAVHTADDDPGVVVHAELSWPPGGGIMLGSAGRDDSPFSQRPVGVASIYVVCDDPDGLFARATGAGAQVVQGLRDEDYGSRGFSVTDPEGNIWSFGTYAGE